MVPFGRVPWYVRTYCTRVRTMVPLVRTVPNGTIGTVRTHVYLLVHVYHVPWYTVYYQVIRSPMQSLMIRGSQSIPWYVHVHVLYVRTYHGTYVRTRVPCGTYTSTYVYVRTYVHTLYHGSRVLETVHVHVRTYVLPWYNFRSQLSDWKRALVLEYHGRNTSTQVQQYVHVEVHARSARVRTYHDTLCPIVCQSVNTGAELD
jgi:hypothetical protein